jgi:hypothetical protein
MNVFAGWIQSGVFHPNLHLHMQGCLVPDGLAMLHMGSGDA